MKTKSEALRIAKIIAQGLPKDIPADPKAYYTSTGDWQGWRDWLGVDASSLICDECGDHPCQCQKN